MKICVFVLFLLKFDAEYFITRHLLYTVEEMRCASSDGSVTFLMN